MKINQFRKLGNLSAAAVIAFSAVLNLALAPTVGAAADTCTWTGAGGDYKFSTAANWTGCDNSTVPESGDTLLFSSWIGPANGASNNAVELTNDMPNVVFGAVTTTGVGTNGDYYIIDSLKVADGAVLTASSAINLSIKNLQSSGVVTLNGPVVEAATVGSLIIQSRGAAYSVDASQLTIKSGAELIGTITNSSYSFVNVDAITIENGAKLFLCGSQGIATVDSSFTLGGGTGASPEIILEPCMGAVGMPAIPSAGATLTGTVTLLSDATIKANNKRLVMKGSLVPNGHKLTLNTGQGGMVMGNGSTGTVLLGNGARIAPGLSPGCINTNDLTFQSGSFYDFEVGGTTACSEYDQIKVVGMVDLGGGSLNTVAYNGFKPVAGQKFVIIDNDGTDKVTGTFNGIAEGGTYANQGVIYSVSYIAGDGNDVELTVLNVPEAPDTGLRVTTSNPVITTTSAIIAAGLIMLARRRLQKAPARK